MKFHFEIWTGVSFALVFPVFFLDTLQALYVATLIPFWIIGYPCFCEEEEKYNNKEKNHQLRKEKLRDLIIRRFCINCGIMQEKLYCIRCSKKTLSEKKYIEYTKEEK